MRTRGHQRDFCSKSATGEGRKQNLTLCEGIFARNPIKWLVGLSLMAACTGSFEGNPNLKLVVPLRGANSVSVVCNGVPQSVTAPGLLLASSDALTNSGVTNAGCSLQPTASQPYDVIGTATGSAVFVSLPAQGVIQRLTPTLTPAPAFALAAIPNFCPTRLALSPDETKLVALDDPADPQSNCVATPRASRVAVFDAVTGALLPNGLLTVASADVRQSGQIAFALDNVALVVLEPFAGSYRLERYALANLTTPPLQSQPLNGFSSSSNAVDVARIGGSGFAVSIGGSSSGQTLNVVLQDAQSNLVVQFGAAVSAVLQTDQSVNVGPANRIVNNRVADNSLTAYLTGSAIVLKRDTQASNPKVIDAARVGIAALDVVFPPDGFIWALTGSSLLRLDPFNFPSVPVISSASLSGGSALALAWVIEP